MARETWRLPSGWTLKSFENDTHILTRVDGVTIHSYQTRMMIWGWQFADKAEPFLDKWEDGIIAEAAAEYPDPADFLPDVDAHYLMEQ